MPVNLMRKAKVRIATIKGDMEVDGFVGQPGLAVTPQQINNAPPSGRWVITHVPTGRIAMQYSFAAPEIAYSAAVRLAERANWDRQPDEMTIVEKLAMLSAVKEVLADFIVLGVETLHV